MTLLLTNPVASPPGSETLNSMAGGRTHSKVITDIQNALMDHDGRLTTVESEIALSGTYTPVLTNVANLISAAFTCQFFRVGNTVTVSGKVSVDPTNTATLTQLGISLPIASGITAEEQCAGTAFCPGVAAQGAAIHGDAANGRAEMIWVAADVTQQLMFFTFTYLVVV